jgi:hypothetical protein
MIMSMMMMMMVAALAGGLAPLALWLVGTAAVVRQCVIFHSYCDFNFRSSYIKTSI